jgi:hypothetical protein
VQEGAVKSLLWVLATAVFVILPMDVATAATVNFDLEDLGEGGIAPNGSVTAWADVTIGSDTHSIGLRIEHFVTGGPGTVPDSDLAIVNLAPWLAGDPVWGDRSLSFFSDPGVSDPSGPDFLTLTPILGSLGSTYGVERITWNMGDFGGTDNDAYSITTYGYVDAPAEYANGKGGTPFEQGATTAGASGFEYSTEYQNRAYAIEWADITAGHPDHPNSLFFDNFALTLSGLEIGGTIGKIAGGGSDAPDTGAGGGGTINLGTATGPGTAPPLNVVPLPAGVWMGLGLLAALGLTRSMRRRPI